MLQKWVDSKQNLLLEEELRGVKRFSYLGSYIPLDGRK